MNRLALPTVAATFVLILAGGLVTNTGAGLAVPDWPTTFGYDMFLFPWSGMVGGRLLLGAGSFLARFSSLAVPGGQVSVLVLPVAHRLVASLVFGAVLIHLMRPTGAAVRRHGADLRSESAVAR